MEAIKDMRLEKSSQGGCRVRVVANHGTMDVDLGADEIVGLLGKLAIDAIGAGEALAPTDLSGVSMGGRYLTVAQLTEAHAYASLAPRVDPDARDVASARGERMDRNSLESLKTVKLLPVGDLDRVAYSTEDAEGYEVAHHVEAPCVRVRPGCSVAQALREISGLGLVQVERYAIDGRLELQCFAGSESFYFVRA